MAKSKSPEPVRPLPDWAAPLAATARTHWHVLCALLIGGGAAIVLASLAGWVEEAGFVAHLGVFVALYGAIVALQHLPPNWGGASLQRSLRGTLVRNGVGFYGVMTLARFLQLELHDLLDDVVTFEPSRAAVMSVLKDWLIGFSADSLRNSIEAFMWPVRLMGAHGKVAAAAGVLAAWSLYTFGSRVFPEAHAALAERKGKRAADGEQPAEATETRPS